MFPCLWPVCLFTIRETSYEDTQRIECYPLSVPLSKQRVDTLQMSCIHTQTLLGGTGEINGQSQSEEVVIVQVRNECVVL